MLNSAKIIPAVLRKCAISEKNKGGGGGGGGGRPQASPLDSSLVIAHLRRDNARLRFL